MSTFPSPDEAPREIPTLLWTLEEVAKATRLSTCTILRLVRDRKIPVHRIGRRVLFAPSDITTWLRSRRIGP